MGLLFAGYTSDRPKFFPKINEIRKRTMKIKNKTLATEAAPSAMPPKPKNAATIAIIKKVIVQRNIKY